jgi:hypothetical protein
VSLFALAAPAEMAAMTAAMEAAEAAAYDFEAWATDMTALYLAQGLAEELDVPLDLVWHSLCCLPHHLVPALATPQGWAGLAAVVACELGVGAPDYRAQVH